MQLADPLGVEPAEARQRYVPPALRRRVGFLPWPWPKWDTSLKKKPGGCICLTNGRNIKQTKTNMWKTDVRKIELKNRKRWIRILLLLPGCVRLLCGFCPHTWRDGRSRPECGGRASTWGFGPSRGSSGGRTDAMALHAAVFFIKKANVLLYFLVQKMISFWYFFEFLFIILK